MLEGECTKRVADENKLEVANSVKHFFLGGGTIRPVGVYHIKNC